MILVADIGATKTLIAVGTFRDRRWRPRIVRRYSDAEYHDFDSVLEAFFAELAAAGHDTHGIRCASLAAAGPVHDRRIELTNRDWCIDPDALARRFAIDHVRVINDFEAAATGIAYLGDDATVTLQPGVPMASAPQVVIGAGSGLGVAYVLQDGRRRHIVSSEGGHASFAPTSLEQAELWRYLFDRKGRVTTEDVVSGPGLLRIHEFLCWRSGTPPPLGALEPATIAESAIAGTELLCARALDLFIECYGAIAGDHALSVCARGGVFLAGGIASRILPRLTGGGLIAAFTAKGPQRALAATIPVRVVTDETLPLIGAASEACRTT